MTTPNDPAWMGAHTPHYSYDPLWTKGQLTTIADNGDGTFSLLVTTIVDVGDGTFTLSGSAVTDNEDGTFTTVVSGGTVSDATTAAKGIVQLAGDLAGTAAAPTVPGKAALQHVAATTTSAAALVVNSHNPVDATGGSKAMTLPTGQAEDSQISVEKTDWTANTVTVSGNIRGVAAQSLALFWQNEDVVFRADSSGSWWPVAGYKPRASVNAAANPVGVYLPDGWGLNWYTKLASAGSSLVRIAVLGDSIGKGYFSSNLDTKGWFGLLAAALQAKYGDGGSGFKGVVDSVTWMSTNGSLTSGIRNFYNTAVCLIGSSGFASAVTGGSGAGPSGNGLKAGAATDTLTWSGGTALRGTTLKVYYLNSGAPFTVTIDGGAPQTVTPTGTTAIGVASYTVSAGSHSLVVTATGWVTGGGAGDVTIYGASGENATGVVCNNFSVYGIASGTYGNGDTLATGTWSGGFNYPADLVLYSLGANDGHNNVAVDTYLANVQGYLAGVLDTKNGGGSFTGSTAAGAADVALVIPHIGGYDLNKAWASYQARFRSLAQGYGAALVDFSAIGKRSWNYWNGLGYWASTASPGTQGSDLVHPDDAGHAFMNTRLQSVLPLLP